MSMLPVLTLDLRNRPPRPIGASERAVLCLGNFDGVHVAHRALLRAGVRSAHANGCPCGVFCFFRPSSDYFPSQAVPNGSGTHLCSLSEKLALFAYEGVDFVCLCDFPSIQSMPAPDFPAFLRAECGCAGIVCGFNYRYGSGGAGTAAALADSFSAPGDISPVILEEQRRSKTDSAPVSSSRIRAALWAGNVPLATELLGRPYSLTGTVVSGKHLGRHLGFPTANLYFPTGRLIPAHGVYAVRVHTPDGIFPGVSNVGVRPTVDRTTYPRPNCETFLINFSGDLYGKRIRIDFLEYLRPEQTFSDLNALRAAIAQDAEQAAKRVFPE